MLHLSQVFYSPYGYTFPPPPHVIFPEPQARESKWASREAGSLARAATGSLLRGKWRIGQTASGSIAHMSGGCTWELAALANCTTSIFTHVDGKMGG